MKRIGIILIVVLWTMVGLCGCATTGQEQQSDDYQQTVGQGTAVGVAGGAILGALIGGLTGGSVQDIVTGAVVGGIAGGVAGHAYGTHVANKKQEYISQEDWLDARIASARSVSDDLASYNAGLESEIASLEYEIANLASAQGSRRDIKNRLARIKTEANQKMSQANYELEAQRSVAVDGSSYKGQELNSQITTLESSRDELQGTLNRMANLEEMVGV